MVVAAAAALRRAPAPVALLLSGLDTRYGSRSIIATWPDETVVVPHGAGLPSVPPRLVHRAHGTGVWIGAFSYDGGLELLGIQSRHATEVPALFATYHATYAAFDHAAGAWELSGPDGVARRALRNAIDAVPSLPTMPEASRRVATSPVTRIEHAAGAEEVRRLIALGEAFEVNLAHVIETPWSETGWDLFLRLLAESPGDHSAYLSWPGGELASISPELFLHIDGDRVETRPIKGTRPRGATAAEDVASRHELLSSVKDRAENVMIVDLLRNDLTATAVPGSVRVTELCTIEQTASVMHLVSSISSTLRPDVRQPDVLVSCFPGGSVTGAPKRRAVELIDRLERTARGFYCGSVFVWEPAARRFRSSITIRTAAVGAGTARYGSGGAVTLQSEPAEEAEETLVKAGPFLRATNSELAGW